MGNNSLPKASHPKPLHPKPSHDAPSSGGVVIYAARWPEDTAAVAALLHEFHAFLLEEHGEDFPVIREDAENLPGPYRPPEGTWLLARVEGRVMGCFALRRHDAAIAEAKRMFIRPAARSMGLGHQLVAGLLAEARSLGYRRVRLDSLRTLPKAHRLYYQHGFTLIPPYNDLPGELVLHMECVL